MAKISYYSQEAYDNLKKDLDNLKNVERPNISNEIAQARDKGDLSENAEYDAAKEAQGLLEMKIADLEEKLLYARVIDTSKLDTDKVLLYSTVTIKNVSTGSILTYTLVSDTEADLSNNKISANSPIGKALLAKKVSDTVNVTVPSGEISFEVLDITRQ
ncbi:MAG: transcription elongation factor GreA [Flavobacteriales bacterium]|nr:transcription elongation factor GreA [Flavobacteriales bacterium]